MLLCYTRLQQISTRETVKEDIKIIVVVN